MRIAILILLSLLLNKSYCQPIKILLGRTSTSIEKYYDTLFVKRSPYYTTQRTVSEKGELILVAEFGLADQPFYKCVGVACLFTRINGVEKCTQQIIVCNKEDSYSHLEYIKDKFKFIKTNKWAVTFHDPALGNEIIAEFIPSDENDYLKYSVL
jgi:hypothetical protein